MQTYKYVITYVVILPRSEELFLFSSETLIETKIFPFVSLTLFDYSFKIIFWKPPKVSR